MGCAIFMALAGWLFVLVIVLGGSSLLCGFTAFYLGLGILFLPRTIGALKGDEAGSGLVLFLWVVLFLPVWILISGGAFGLAMGMDRSKRDE